MIALNEPLGGGGEEGKPKRLPDPETPAPAPVPKPDSSNQFAVGVLGKLFVINMPVPRPMTREQALNLAAWLAVLVDPDGKEFERLVKEIKNT